DRLSVRWYLGYNLGEPVPDHSSLTRIRTHYGLEVFRRFFASIVEQCQQAGLVWGRELYVDATPRTGRCLTGVTRAPPCRRGAPRDPAPAARALLGGAAGSAGSAGRGAPGICASGQPSRAHAAASRPE